MTTPTIPPTVHIAEHVEDDDDGGTTVTVSAVLVLVVLLFLLALAGVIGTTVVAVYQPDLFLAIWRENRAR
jgi:hypothetical protein